MARERTRVVLNQRVFGEQVMGGPKMVAAMEAIGRQVAAKVPGAEVETEVTPVKRGNGGRRARAIVSFGSDKDEADNGTLLNALNSTVPGSRRT